MRKWIGLIMRGKDILTTILESSLTERMKLVDNITRGYKKRIDGAATVGSNSGMHSGPVNQQITTE